MIKGLDVVDSVFRVICYIYKKNKILSVCISCIIVDYDIDILFNLLLNDKYKFFINIYNWY